MRIVSILINLINWEKWEKIFQSVANSNLKAAG